MKTKLILFTFVLISFLLIGSMTIVSASTVAEKSNFFDKVFSSFTGNVIDEGNGIERNGNFVTGYKYKDYSEEQRIVKIDDGKGKIFAKVKLISPQTNQVFAGEDIMVAEFLFEDFDINSSQNVMTDMKFYDLNNNTKEMKKEFKLKYFNNENNSVLWNEFSKFNELPSKNIRVGLFTDTTLGESVEWIPEMFNFRISEWAAYQVTSYGPTSYASYATYRNSITYLTGEYAVAVYEESPSGKGRIHVVHVFDNGTIVKGAELNYDNSGNYPDIIKVDDSHVLVASRGYVGAAVVEQAVLFKVYTNNLTLVQRAEVSVDADEGGQEYSVLTQMDSTHFLVTYQSYHSSVQAVHSAVITVSTATPSVSAATPVQTYNAYAVYMRQTKLQDNLYAITLNNGYVIVIQAYTNGTIVAGTPVLYGAGGTIHDTTIERFSNTKALIVYLEGSSTKAQIINIFSNNLSSGLAGTGLSEPDVAYNSGRFSSVDLGNERDYVVVYENISGSNYALRSSIYTVYSNNTITSVKTPHFSSDANRKRVDSHSASVKGPATRFVYVAYSIGTQGSIATLKFDPCYCPGLNQNWVIDLSQYCVITADCNIGTGLLSFSNTGNATFSATIKVANMTAPGSGGTLYISSAGLLNITSHGG